MRYLDRAEYRCEQAFTLSEAMMKVACYDYDCVLLDLMLPGLWTACIGPSLHISLTSLRTMPQGEAGPRPANGKMAGCIYGSLEAAQKKLQCFRFFLDALAW